MRARSIAILAGLSLLLGASAGAAVAAGYVAVDPPRQIGEIVLTGSDKAKIDKTALAGRWTFITLGFTHCSDVCPMMLSHMATIRARMAETLPSNALPRLMFVSVDPARDAPDILGDYVRHFAADFIGATGTKPQLDALVKSLGAFYRIGRKRADGFYSVDHSAELYLLDPELRLRARFQPPLDTDAVQEAYKGLGAAPRSRAGATTLAR